MEITAVPNLSDWQMCFASQRKFPTTSEKLIVGLPLLGITTASLISNLCLVYYNIFVIFKNAKNNCPFVLILVNNFAFAHIGYALTNFISSIPSILSPSIIYSNSAAQFFTASFNTYFSLTVIFLNFLVTFERLMYFFDAFPKHVITFIQRKLPYAIWGMAMTFGIATEISGCQKRFNQWSMMYAFTCHVCQRREGFEFSQLFNYWGAFSPIGLLIIYVPVFYLIIKNKWRIGLDNNTISHVFSELEVKVTINFLIVCVSQWLTSLLTFYGPIIFGTSYLFIPVLINFVGAFNGLVQPIILIFCNPRARKQIWIRFLHAKRVNSANMVGNISMMIPKIAVERTNY